MKVFWRNIHLWLGLAVSLVFFVECITGTLLVFEDEVTQMMHYDRFFANENQSEPLTLDEMVAKVQAHIKPSERINSIKLYADSRKNAEFSLAKKENSRKELKSELPDKPKGKQKEGRAELQKPGKKGGDRQQGGRGPKGDVVYVNPYTAQITDRVSPDEDTFFKFILKLHMSLSMESVGKTILGMSTFVVLIILFTGIVLWWPKTRKILKSRLKLKLNGSWKRVNHDLHVVLGFYCTFFLIIFLLTSLPWSFKWANEALYIITNSKPIERGEPLKLEPVDSSGVLSLQEILAIGQKTFPDVPYWSFELPKKDTDLALNISSSSTEVLHNNGFDKVTINPFTGAVLAIDKHVDTPGGWQLRRYMKPVHTGAIGGIPTKIIAFLVCLISASFPVTGIILWMNRTRKKKPARKVRKQVFHRTVRKPVYTKA